MKDPAQKWWDFLRNRENTNKTIKEVSDYGAPDASDFRDQERSEKLEAIYLQYLKPHAEKILGRIINQYTLAGRRHDSAEDFCHDLAIAAEGNDNITIMEFLLEAVGENTDDIVSSEKERERGEA